MAVPLGFVRPMPPAPPSSWLDELPDGADVEIALSSGGWWAGTAVSKRGTASSRRSTIKYLIVPSNGSDLPALAVGGERLVPPEELRPCWAHLGKGKGYRLGHDHSVEVEQAAVSSEAAAATEQRLAFDAALVAAEEAHAEAAAAAAAAAAASSGAPAPSIVTAASASEAKSTAASAPIARRSGRGAEGAEEVSLEASIALLESLQSAGRKRGGVANRLSPRALGWAAQTNDARTERGILTRQTHKARSQGALTRPAHEAQEARRHRDARQRGAEAQRRVGTSRESLRLQLLLRLLRRRRLLRRLRLPGAPSADWRAGVLHLEI